MRSRIHAAAAAALLCIAGWLLTPLLPLLSCMSGAAVSLVMLRHGVVQGAIVTVLSGMVLGAAAFLAYGTVNPALWVVLVVWLPAQLCAMVLRHTRSQGWTVVTAALLAALCAGGVRIATGDVTAWWRRLLDAVVEAIREGGGGAAITAEQLDTAAAMLNSLMAASFTVTLVLTVLLARHWQAMLYNPGGFGPEFRALQLPRLPSLAVTGVLLVILVLSQQQDVRSAALGYAVDLLAVSVCALGFHGLALAHYTVTHRQMGYGWLIGLYGLLVLMPIYAVATLAAAGLADVVLDIRTRATIRTGKQ